MTIFGCNVKNFLRKNLRYTLYYNICPCQQVIWRAVSYFHYFLYFLNILLRIDLHVRPRITSMVAKVAKTIFGCNVKNFLRKKFGYALYYNIWPSQQVIWRAVSYFHYFLYFLKILLRIDLHVRPRLPVVSQKSKILFLAVILKIS